MRKRSHRGLGSFGCHSGFFLFRTETGCIFSWEEQTIKDLLPKKVKSKSSKLQAETERFPVATVRYLRKPREMFVFGIGFSRWPGSASYLISARVTQFFASYRLKRSKVDGAHPKAVGFSTCWFFGQKENPSGPQVFFYLSRLVE